MNNPQRDCPLCRSSSSRVMFDLRRRQEPLAVPGWVLRCAGCGFWYKAVTGELGLEALYGEAYAHGPHVEGYHCSESTRRFFLGVLRGLETRGSSAGLRLLDVGTGPGLLLEVARELGYEAEGVDVCPTFVESARRKGLVVHQVRAEEFRSAEPFDVLTMMDFIEHVPDPVGTLASLARNLRPGGELIVYTPNHRAAVVGLARLAAKLGADFAVREIFAGNHLCFFDDRTLPLALDRAGFSLRGMRRPPYQSRLPGKSISRVSLFAVTLLEWAGAPFGRTFRMIAYARKAA